MTDGSGSGGPVLLVNLAVGFGGAEARVIDTARGLDQDLGALAVIANSPLDIRARRSGVAVAPLEFGRGDPRLVGAIRAVIRAGNYEVVDAHNVQSQLWGHMAARAEHVPVIVSTVHSEYRRENQGLKGRVHEFVLRRNASWGCRFIGVSEPIGNYLRELGVPGTSIDVVRRGFPVEVAPRATTIDRASLGWDSDDLVVGVIGRLAPAKGHERLLEALSILGESRRAVRCYIVGDGPLASRLADLARSMGLEGDVRFSGFTDDVASVFEMVDFICLPSLTEGLPNVALEAATAHVPLILTRVGEIPALFVDGRDALLADPDDPSSLADAIQRALGLDDRGRELASSANVSLEEALSEDWIAATRDVYGI